MQEGSAEGEESDSSDCVILGVGVWDPERKAKAKAIREIRTEAEYEARVARDGHIVGQRGS